MSKPLKKLVPTLVLLLLSSLSVPLAARADDPRSRLEDLYDQIARKRAAIARAEQREKSLLHLIAQSDQRRDALADRLAIIEERLGAAEGRLAVVQAELDNKRERLEYLRLRLRVTTDILQGRIDALNQRASLSYELGPGGILNVLLGSDDFGDLIGRQEFIGFALAADSSAVDAIDEARKEVGARRDAIRIQRDLIREQRDLYQAEVDRIDVLRAERQELLDQVEYEIAVRESSLETVRASKREWERAVEAWEKESDKIEAQLSGQGSSGTGHYNGELFWPTAGGIGSGFGWRIHPIYHTQRFHAGVDIGGACGQPIWAAEDGTVISAGYNGGYGYATVIDHGGGLATLYAHQPYVMVSAGQHVNRAEQIGVVGSTGLSTACHLHFEVRINGTPVDPVPYLT
jgi:murein DD-endopeptidase MepM/ murein hydrolase activator NlpD